MPLVGSLGKRTATCWRIARAIRIESNTEPQDVGVQGEGGDENDDLDVRKHEPEQDHRHGDGHEERRAHCAGSRRSRGHIGVLGRGRAGVAHCHRHGASLPVAPGLARGSAGHLCRCRALLVRSHRWPRPSGPPRLRGASESLCPWWAALQPCQADPRVGHPGSIFRSASEHVHRLLATVLFASSGTLAIDSGNPLPMRSVDT